MTEPIWRNVNAIIIYATPSDNYDKGKIKNAEILRPICVGKKAMW